MLYWFFILCSAGATVGLSFLFSWGDRLYEWGLMLLTFVGAFVACLLVYAIFAVTLSLFLSNKRPIKRQNPFLRIVTIGFLRLFLRLCGVRITVQGMEKLPQDQTFLWVGNHRTFFDPMIAMVAFARYRMAFVSKKENLEIPFGGKYIHHYGCIAMDRQSIRGAAEAARQTAEVLKDGRNMGIYPEGGTNRTQEPLLPFKEGVFSIAKRANVPIVIAVMHGIESLKQNTKKLRKTHVKVEILEVISAQTVAEQRPKELCDYTYEKMLGALLLSTKKEN